MLHAIRQWDPQQVFPSCLTPQFEVRWMNDSFFSLYSSQVTKNFTVSYLYNYTIFLSSSWDFIGFLLTSALKPWRQDYYWVKLCLCSCGLKEWKMLLQNSNSWNFSQTSVVFTISGNYCRRSIASTLNLTADSFKTTWNIFSGVFMRLHRITRWFLTIAKFNILVFLSSHFYKSTAKKVFHLLQYNEEGADFQNKIKYILNSNYVENTVTIKNIFDFILKSCMLSLCQN